MASPLGSAPGIMLGVGVGNAASAALDPLVEPGRQQAWKDHPNRVLDPGLMARLVAQGAVALGTGQGEASREGFNENRFNRLVYLAQRVPGMGELDRLSNRRLITPDQLDDALNRHAFPKDWHRPLKELMQDILTPGELAAATHRGLVPDPGLLRGEQPAGPFKVEAYPVYDIDVLAEAAGSGYDRDRLGVLVGLQGLPMGTHEAAQALFRGIITHGDYIRAFNESNSRNEWAQAVLDYTRQIPTARDFIENALRGYRTLAEAQQGAALHGMSPEHARLIFQNSGRPLNLHQITQALAWGAKYNPLPGDDPDPYMNAVLIGPVTPAYYEMQDTLKYNLPSAFYFRTLQEQDVLKEAEAATWYRRLGWPPQLADLVAKAYAQPATTAAKVDPHVAKAQTQLWTATHSSYIKRLSTGAQAQQRFALLGIPAAAQTTILELWASERSLVHAQLTPKQVKDAWVNQVINPATGAAWTEAEALQALLDRGYAQNEAETFLHE